MFSELTIKHFSLIRGQPFNLISYPFHFIHVNSFKLSVDHSVKSQYHSAVHNFRRKHIHLLTSPLQKPNPSTLSARIKFHPCNPLIFFLIIPFSILPAIFFQILLTIVPTPLEHTFQALSTVMKMAMARWTTPYLLKILLFPDSVQRCQFSLTQSGIPRLFPCLEVIHFSLNFPDLWQPCLTLSFRKRDTLSPRNSLQLTIKTVKDKQTPSFNLLAKLSTNLN